jgi:NodT family efflux transporter outer membrane factor (OMF) lipoprotein
MQMTHLSRVGGLPQAGTHSRAEIYLRAERESGAHCLYRPTLLSGFGISLAGLLTACAPHVDPLVQPRPIETYDTAAAFQAMEGAWPKSDWWTAYGDPQLDALIDEALKGSPDLAIAVARVRQADAAAATARVALRPSLDASGNVSGYRESINQGIPDRFKDFLPHGWHDRGDAEVDGGWDIDLFGRNRATYAAATSDVVAAKVDAEAARLSLTTAVATSYASLVQLVAERAALQVALRIRNDSAGVATARYRQSLENQGVTMQAQARVAQAQADLDNVEGRIVLARNQLAALLGEGPDRGLTVALPARPPLTPLRLPPSLAANLLGRRPDIVAARVRIEAASSRIDVARADFYPNISLTGQVGLQTIGLSDFFKAGSISDKSGLPSACPFSMGAAVVPHG